jgi:PelA/Pel-15E family pectate lyase
MHTINPLGLVLWLAVASACGLNLPAAILGTNTPALAVAAERIATLPAAERTAWTRYLQRSERQWQLDQQFLVSELKKHGLKESVSPPRGGSSNRPPLGKPSAWYAQPEARRIAEVVISFQTPAGGWSKGVDMTRRPRAPGEQFTSSDARVRVDPLDNDRPRNIHWSYVGTFDNNATTTQLRYLAKVIAATTSSESETCRNVFVRGLEYVIAAQYPNGGWPQVWPLQGGYHDAITYNDGAMINIMELMTDVAQRTGEFSWVPVERQKAASESLERGIACVLATQIISGGRRTVWCQQHDALTLQPTSARNYEMPSQSGSESAGIMRFLMRLPHPGSNTVTAVHAAADWFERTSLRDVVYERVGNDDRQLIRAPGAGPLWARYYAIGTDRPLFGDRDKTIHDDVMEISKERRKGYGWFGQNPTGALREYLRWKATHPPTGAQYH